MKKNKRTLFHFRPFSKKQRKVLNWWCNNSPVKNMDGIIADGAIRSGKTLSMSLSFVFWAMESFNGQNFGMCGKTIGSFRRNVLFLLKLMLRSRGYNITDYLFDYLLCCILWISTSILIKTAHFSERILSSFHTCRNSVR